MFSALQYFLVYSNVYQKTIFFLKNWLLKAAGGTPLVAQWLRTRLPIQGTRVQALVREDPTWHGATKRMRHNY